jgi:hypothetical protein
MNSKDNGRNNYRSGLMGQSKKAKVLNFHFY